MLISKIIIVLLYHVRIFSYRNTLLSAFSVVCASVSAFSVPRDTGVRGGVVLS